MLEQIKKALEGVDHELDLDSLHIMSKSDFETLSTNHKAEIEEVKVKSNQIGREILLKELKNDIGLEYEKRKDPEALKTAFKNKFGSDDADIKELTEKFTKQLEEKEIDIENIKSQYKAESDSKTIKEALRNQFTQYSDKTNYKTDDLVTIALSKSDFTVIDGNVFQTKDGEVIKNDLLQGINSEAYVKSMMQDGYIKKAEGGKIRGDETKGGKYSMEEFINAQESKGVNSNSLEFAQNLEAAQKEGKLEL